MPGRTCRVRDIFQRVSHSNSRNDNGLEYLASVIPVTSPVNKLLLLLLCLPLYVATAELGAMRKAERFCGTLSVGQDSEGLQTRAIEAGARVGPTGWHDDAKGVRHFYAHFTGFAAGSDFICQVDARNGKITGLHPNVMTSLLETGRR